MAHVHSPGGDAQLLFQSSVLCSSPLLSLAVLAEEQPNRNNDQPYPCTAEGGSQCAVGGEDGVVRFFSLDPLSLGQGLGKVDIAAAVQAWDVSADARTSPPGRGRRGGGGGRRGGRRGELGVGGEENGKEGRKGTLARGAKLPSWAGGGSGVQSEGGSRGKGKRETATLDLGSAVLSLAYLPPPPTSSSSSPSSWYLTPRSRGLATAAQRRVAAGIPLVVATSAYLVQVRQ